MDDSFVVEKKVGLPGFLPANLGRRNRNPRVLINWSREPYFNQPRHVDHSGFFFNIVTFFLPELRRKFGKPSRGQKGRKKHPNHLGYEQGHPLPSSPNPPKRNVSLTQFLYLSSRWFFPPSSLLSLLFFPISQLVCLTSCVFSSRVYA